MVSPPAYVSTCQCGYLPTCLPADVATARIPAYVSPTAHLSPMIRRTVRFVPDLERLTRYVIHIHHELIEQPTVWAYVSWGKNYLQWYICLRSLTRRNGDTDVFGDDGWGNCQVLAFDIKYILIARHDWSFHSNNIVEEKLVVCHFVAFSVVLH